MKKFVMISYSLLLISSCGSRQVLTPLEPVDEFERAISFYENRNYNKAIEAFERIIFYHPSSEYVDDAQYWLARTYFGKREYNQAIIEFDYLIRNFPNSNFLEESYLYRAKSYLLMAPNYFKDLTDVRKAINLFDEFITKFPNSKYVDDAKKSLLSIRNLLAKKELENGKLYLKMNELDAALLYFDYIIKNYPETDVNNDAKYYSATIYERKGNNKQALDLYKELLDDADWQKKVEKRIEKLENKIEG